jgi:hypothetical protein
MNTLSIKVSLVVADISTRGWMQNGKKKNVKILAAQLDLRQNDLIEEAIIDLIEKYKHKEHHAANG